MRRDCLCLAVALCARLLAAAAALVPSGETICIDEGAVEKAENVPAADWCLRSGETVAVLSGRTGALQSLKGADGRAVPGLSFVFHEWMSNFSGNQCGCRSDPFFRMAYSFHCGDMMSVVLGPDGKIVTSWTTPWTDPLPDQAAMTKMVRDLNGLRKRHAGHLYDGRMIRPFADVRTALATDGDPSFAREYPCVLSSFWEDDAGVRLGFLTNWRDEPASATLVFADGRTESLTLSARETRVVEGGLPLARQGKPKEGF